MRLHRVGHLCRLASQAAARSTSPHSKHTLRELFMLRQGELCCAGPGSMQRRRSATWTRSGDHRRSRSRTRRLRHKKVLLTLNGCERSAQTSQVQEADVMPALQSARAACACLCLPLKS